MSKKVTYVSKDYLQKKSKLKLQYTYYVFVEQYDMHYHWNVPNISGITVKSSKPTGNWILSTDNPSLPRPRP